MDCTKLYFGTGYYDERNPRSRAKEDIALMKAAGINLIRIGAAAWPYWEPEEGVYDFTPLHRVLACAQGCGMAVIVEIPENILPAWLVSGHPEILADGSVQYENRAYVQALTRLVQELTAQCRPYSCVIGYRMQDGCDAESHAALCTMVREIVGADRLLVGCCGMKAQGNPDGITDKADRLDIAGCEVYHPAGLRNTGREISFMGDFARGLKKRSYLVLETQSQGQTGQLPYPGQLRLAAFHHIAQGAAGVIYDDWLSERSGDRKGVLGHSMMPGEIYRECAVTGAEFARLSDKLSGMKKQNRVAIMVSTESAKRARWAENSAMGYWEYFSWVYDSLSKLNIEVDVIPDTRRDFTGYELLIVPCLYCAEDNLIWAIRDFVSGGGNLIATFRSFFADENGTVRAEPQPYGMTEVFGAGYESYTVPQETSLPEYAADVSEWMELLSVEGGQTVAKYKGPAWSGTPAAVSHRFGKGNAAYIGCYSEEGLEPILLRLLTSWHIPVPEIAWPVVIRRGISKEGRPITFVLHYSSTSRVIPSPTAGTELLSGRSLEEGAPLELKAWDVKILEGNV